MSEPTDSPSKVSPRAQPDNARVDKSAAEDTVVHPPSAPSTTYDNKVPDFFKPGYVVQIPLYTLQDVFRARNYAQLVSSQTRPVLSDLEFTFRAIWDGDDGTSIIRITRVTHHHKPHADPETELAACLRLHSQDHRIPVRILNMYNEATKTGGGWIARHWTDKSQTLTVGRHIWLWYYHFFKEIALRKEGKDWDGADLGCVIELFADLRGR